MGAIFDTGQGAETYAGIGRRLTKRLASFGSALLDQGTEGCHIHDFKIVRAVWHRSSSRTR